MVAIMARPKNTETLENVAGAVTPGVKEALENYRWSVRKTQSQVVREAIEFFVAGKDLTVTEPTVAEPTEPVVADVPAEPKAKGSTPKA